MCAKGTGQRPNAAQLHPRRPRNNHRLPSLCRICQEGPYGATFNAEELAEDVETILAVNTLQVLHGILVQLKQVTRRLDTISLRITRIERMEGQIAHRMGMVPSTVWAQITRRLLKEEENNQLSKTQGESGR